MCSSHIPISFTLIQVIWVLNVVFLAYQLHTPVNGRLTINDWTTINIPQFLLNYHSFCLFNWVSLYFIASSIGLKNIVSCYVMCPSRKCAIPRVIAVNKDKSQDLTGRNYILPKKKTHGKNIRALLFSAHQHRRGVYSLYSFVTGQQYPEEVNNFLEK